MNHTNAKIGYLLFAGALSIPVPVVALYQAQVEDIVANTIDSFSKNRQIELPQGCTLESTRKTYNKHLQEIDCPEGLSIRRTLEVNHDGSGMVNESIFQNGVGREIRDYEVDPSGSYNYVSFNFCSRIKEELGNPIIFNRVKQLILEANHCPHP